MGSGGCIFSVLAAGCRGRWGARGGGGGGEKDGGDDRGSLAEDMDGRGWLGEGRGDCSIWCQLRWKV